MLRRATFIMLFLLFAFCADAKQNPVPKKTTTEKLVKLIEPWPDADTLRQRRTDAEDRALFQGTEPLTFTIESDFATVNKDRDPNSTKKYPAVIAINGINGQQKTIALNVSPRGHVRRMAITCSFVPLRLEFTKNATKGTALEGPASELKLVTHCQSSKEHEQFILREYLTYKLSNILTPRSFRARLAKVTYVDSKNHKPITTRYGIILEDDGDVARRMEGRKVSLERTSFTDLEPDILEQMMVFEYMIGNTDYSVYALHNVVLIQTRARTLYPVAYDFDQSGLVHAPYALPAPNLGLKSVLDRAYRGPCRTPEQLEPVFSVFRAKKSELMAAIDSIGDLSQDSRAEVRNYLNDFFSMIDRSSAVKKVFVDGCKRTTM